MQVIIDPQREAEIQRLVASGKYASPEAVVADALRLLSEQAAYWSDVNEKIEMGLAQLNAGQRVPGGEAFARLEEKSRRRRIETAQ